MVHSAMPSSSLYTASRCIPASSKAWLRACALLMIINHLECLGIALHRQSASTDAPSQDHRSFQNLAHLRVPQDHGSLHNLAHLKVPRSRSADFNRRRRWNEPDSATDTSCRHGSVLETPSSRPITFTSSAAYAIATFRPYMTFCITFSLKTVHSNGLILFSGDVISGSGSSGAVGSDFMSVELSGGSLRYSFDLGGGARVLQHHLATISDNKWHVVSISRPNVDEHRLQVDDHVITTDDLPPPSPTVRRSLYLDTGDQLYVGGVPAHAYNALPAEVRSRDGFIGCLAQLHLDASHVAPVDLVGNPFGIPEQYRRQIRSGCPDMDWDGSASGVGCSDEDSEACMHGGTCVTRTATGVLCNCETTSFTGQHCSDDSIAYRFNNRSGGLVAFTFPGVSWPDTKRDHLALGFITNQSDAVLVRITSGSSTDYIELELVDGNVLVVYNMGIANHPVGELFEKVNDGRYHRVSFHRDGPNATIQVDDLPVQAKFPAGQQLTTFNQQSRIFVGGKKDEINGRIVRAFDGVIAGVVFNGLRILDLAAGRDERVHIEGDVELEVNPLTVAQSTRYGKLVPIPTRRKPPEATQNVPSKIYPSKKPIRQPQQPNSQRETKTGSTPRWPCSWSPGENGRQDCLHQSAGSASPEFSKPRHRTTAFAQPVTTSPATMTQSEDDDNDVIEPCVDDGDEDCGEDGNGNGSGLEESSRDIDDEDQTEHDHHLENSDDDEETIDVTTTLSEFRGHLQLATTSTSVPLYLEIEETRYTYREDEDQEIDNRHVIEPEVDIAPDELVDQVDRFRNPSSASTGSSGGVASSSQQFGTNLGLIAGIAAGIVVLMTILVYAVCRYRGCSPRQGEGTKEFVDIGGPRSTAAGTRSAAGICSSGDVVLCDGSRRPHVANATTPLLRGDSGTSGSGNLPQPVPLNASNGSDVLTSAINGFDCNGRQSKKEVQEWFV